MKVNVDGRASKRYGKGRAVKKFDNPVRSNMPLELKTEVISLWDNGNGMSLWAIARLKKKNYETIKRIADEYIQNKPQYEMDKIFEAAKGGDWKDLKDVALRNIVRKVVVDEDVATCKWVIGRKDNGDFGDGDDGAGKEAADALGVT